MVSYYGQGLPAAALTNSAYAECVYFMDKGVAGLKERDGVRIITGSFRRFRIAADRVEAFEPSSAEHAVNYAFDTLDKVGGDGTLWSLVFNTQDLRVYFRTLSQRTIGFLSLNDFDLSCETPDVMMDIHEKLDGNTAEKMQVYSSDRNFDFLKRAIVRWNIPIINKQLQNFRTILDSYQCE